MTCHVLHFQGRSRTSVDIDLLLCSLIHVRGGVIIRAVPITEHSIRSELLADSAEIGRILLKYTIRCSPSDNGCDKVIIFCSMCSIICLFYHRCYIRVHVVNKVFSF